MFIRIEIKNTQFTICYHFFTWSVLKTNVVLFRRYTISVFDAFFFEQLWVENEAASGKILRSRHLWHLNSISLRLPCVALWFCAVSWARRWNELYRICCRVSWDMQHIVSHTHPNTHNESFNRKSVKEIGKMENRIPMKFVLNSVLSFCW